MNTNQQVDAFIASAAPEQQSLLKTLRGLVHESIPGVTEDFKWSRPVFRAQKDLAYLATTRNYVTLGFYDATSLADPDGRLEGTGKQMRHLKIRSKEDLDDVLIAGWLRQLSQ